MDSLSSYMPTRAEERATERMPDQVAIGYIRAWRKDRQQQKDKAGK